jgi:AcrR family transcriptional regulator
MSVTSEEQSTRERILEAALIEFTDWGVAASSIDRIRRRSNASVGSIYHHFGGKLELADELYLSAMRAYQHGFVAELERAGCARDGVRAIVKYHLGWVQAHERIARFLLLGAEPRRRSPLRRLNRGFFAQVRRWTREQADAGALRDLDFDTLSALWIGPSQELTRHWLAGHSRISPTTAAPALAEAAWRSLCP